MAMASVQAQAGLARPAATSRASARTCVVVRAAQQQRSEGVTRREASIAALAAVAALTQAAPAQALFGFGDKEDAEKYTASTGAMISHTLAAATMAKDDPAREATMDAIRTEVNGWVASYRRDTRFSGRPSYSNTYSAVNAMAGHLNSFGPKAAIPKKRLDRMVKELEDAQRFLERGR